MKVSVSIYYTRDTILGMYLSLSLCLWIVSLQMMAIYKSDYVPLLTIGFSFIQLRCGLFVSGHIMERGKTEIPVCPLLYKYYL
jgi:hypothetical protein